GPRWSPDPTVAAVSRRVAGLRIASVEKAPTDRSVRLGAADGAGLAIELQPHASNLVYLGPGMVIDSALRNRRRSAERLTPGRIWQPAPLPPDRRDLFAASAAELDEGLERYAGLGPEAQTLARLEAERNGRTAGAVLAERL